MKTRILAVVLLLTALVAPAEAQEAALGPALPYHAPKARAELIIRSSGGIKPGMTKEQVVGLLGGADEEHPTYAPQKGPGASKQTGFSWVYLVQRLSDRGSEKDKGERLLRVLFDLKGRVIRADRKDLPEGKGKGKEPRKEPAPAPAKAQEFFDSEYLSHIYEEVYSESAEQAFGFLETYLTEDAQLVVEVGATSQGLDTGHEIWVRTYESTTGKTREQHRLTVDEPEAAAVSPMPRATYDKTLVAAGIAKANEALARLTLVPGDELPEGDAKLTFSKDRSKAEVSVGETRWSVPLPRLAPIEKRCCEWSEQADVVSFSEAKCWEVHLATVCRWDGENESSPCFHPEACGDECPGTGERELTSFHCSATGRPAGHYSTEPYLPPRPEKAKEGEAL